MLKSVIITVSERGPYSPRGCRPPTLPTPPCACKFHDARIRMIVYIASKPKIRLGFVGERCICRGYIEGRLCDDAKGCVEGRGVLYIIAQVWCDRTPPPQEPHLSKRVRPYEVAASPYAPRLFLSIAQFADEHKHPRRRGPDRTGTMFRF